MHLEPFPKQEDFITAALSGDFTRLLYGGGIRGGKTFCLLTTLYILCKVFPGSRWAVVRKDLPRIKRNILPSFEKTAPRPFFGRVNRSDFEVTAQNGSKVIFFPENIEQDKDLDRWKGLEVNGFILEEANELSEAAYHKAVERSGSWNVPRGAEQPPPLILMSCNPAHNWVKRLFYDPWKKGGIAAPYYFQPATIFDNPHNDSAYVESVMEMKESAPAQYERFVMGDWSLADDPQQLIPYEWVERALKTPHKRGTRKLGCDVARYGDDDSAICYIEGNTVRELQTFSGLALTDFADEISLMASLENIEQENIAIDSVGIGAGVVDILRKDGFDVMEFVAGGKPLPNYESVFKFRNIRSQAWWMLREAFREGAIRLDFRDERLITELTSIHYKVDGDKCIRVESKDDIKKRLGNSPDAGDALMMGWIDLHADDFIFA